MRSASFRKSHFWRIASLRARLRSDLRWRAAAAIGCATCVAIVVAWFVLAFPLAQPIGGARWRTSYGVLGWIEAVSQQEQRGIATVLPVRIVGAVEVHPTTAALTSLMTIGLGWFTVRYLRRTLQNLSPRWRCQACGHIVSAAPRTNVCPECGELPNLRREAWEVWK